jgi:hypothetical protein
MDNYVIIFNMFERAPESLKDRNSTLDLGRRAANLAKVYQDTLPELVDQNVPLDPAIRAIHRVALDGLQTSGLKTSRMRLLLTKPQVNVEPGQYRDRQTTDILRYKTAIVGKGQSELDGKYKIYIPCPREELVPDLMEGISTKFEQMLYEVDGYADAVKLAAWADHIPLLTHPFYDGNGRACRALVTYAMQRGGQPPLYLENRREDRKTRALPFLTSMFKDTAAKLYAKNIRALPPYIPLSRNPVTAKDIFGLPYYDASIETMIEQKQRSLEYLLSEHIDTVTMQEVRKIFTADEVDAYGKNAQPLPG